MAIYDECFEAWLEIKNKTKETLKNTELRMVFDRNRWNLPIDDRTIFKIYRTSFLIEHYYQNLELDDKKNE